MTARERKLAALLAETLRFWRRVERCEVCVGPAMALEGRHEKEWKRLRERAERELAALPN
jgi:hypothetical protein